MRRILGSLMMFIGTAGIVISITGVVVGRRIVGSLAERLQANLTLTVESLETVEDTLHVTKRTLGQVEEALVTVEDTAVSVSQTITNTRPLLTQLTVVSSQEIPESIEAVQDATPALIDVADAIDRTLRVLNNFRIDETILGIPIRYDLGVDYDPEVPFDESVREIALSLDGIPAQLRSLEGYVEVTDQNLRIMSSNISDIADSLQEVNSNIGQIEPLVDDYIEIVTTLSDSSRQTRTLIAEQMDQVKLAVTVVMVWLGLTQIAPLYLGWELLIGRRE